MNAAIRLALERRIHAAGWHGRRNLPAPGRGMLVGKILRWAVEKLARLAGARLVLREVAHEKELTPGSVLHLQMKWANVGVGKL